VMILASVGLPLTSGFPGELMMMTALTGYHIWLAVLAGTGLILGVVYMLASFRRAMAGASSEKPFDDLNTREKFVFGVLACLVFMIGVFPSLFLKTTMSSVDLLVNLFRIQ